MKIVDAAINLGDFVLAEKVSSEIYAYTTRDDTYMKIVNVAINVRNFELAERASRQIYVSTTQANATKLIVEAIAVK